MIFRTVDTPVVTQLNLCLFHRSFDHGNDEVSLSWDHGSVEKLLVTELNYNLIILEALVYSLDHAKVICLLTMILVSVHH